MTDHVLRTSETARLTTPRPADWAWFAACVGLSSAWCVSAGAELGATFDEPLYLARGLEAWRSGSHAGLLRLGTMPLPADLQTLPLYLLESARGARIDLATELPALLPMARAATVSFWVLLLFAGWHTGLHLAGRLGGALAVALLASEPSLLAHAALATTDIALAACLLALAYAFASARDAPPWRRRGVPALWFGLALLAKASALVMGTLCLLAIAAWQRWDDRGQAPRPTSQTLRDVGWIAGVGVTLAFVVCGTDWLPERAFVAWAHALPDGTLGRGALVWTAEHLRIFSNAGETLVRQIRHNLRGHGAFLLGSVHPRAVWYYFPVLLTLKLSEPLLIGTPLLAAFRWRALANWPIVAAAVLVAASLTFRVQLGVRMVLPIVVFAALGVAVAAARLLASLPSGAASARVGQALLGLALAWNVHVAWALWPDALVHVNRFWGGSAGGYRLVSDSNYDWGQGIPELLRWQRAHDADAIAVWYFGTDPRAARPPLHLTPLHLLPIGAADDLAAAAGGRLLAVSTTLLFGADPTAGGLEGESYRRAVAALRGRTPIGRTRTFLIYDLGGSAAK